MRGSNRTPRQQHVAEPTRPKAGVEYAYATITYLNGHVEKVRTPARHEKSGRRKGATRLWNDIVPRLKELQRKKGLDPVGAVVEGGPMLGTNSTKADWKLSVPKELRGNGWAAWPIERGKGSKKAVIVPVDAAFIHLGPITSRPRTFDCDNLSDIERIRLRSQTQSIPRKDKAQESQLWPIVTAFPELLCWMMGTDSREIVTSCAQDVVDSRMSGDYTIGGVKVSSHKVQARPDGRLSRIVVDGGREVLVNHLVELKAINFARRNFSVYEDINVYQTWMSSLVYGDFLAGNNPDSVVEKVHPLLVTLYKDKPGAGRWYRFSAPCHEGPASMTCVASGEFTIENIPWSLI